MLGVGEINNMAAHCALTRFLYTRILTKTCTKNSGFKYIFNAFHRGTAASTISHREEDLILSDSCVKVQRFSLTLRNKYSSSSSFFLNYLATASDWC